MKNFKLLASTALALSLLFASCSVEKRHYTKGFNVEWNGKKEKATETAKKSTVNDNQASAKPAVAIEEKAVVATTEQASVVTETTAAPVAKPYEQTATETKSTKTSGVKKAFGAYGNMMGQSKVGNVVKTQSDKYAKKDIKDVSDTLALIAFICGILALISYYVAFFFALAAIILGFLSIKKTSGMSHTFALLGIIFGFIAILLWLVLFLFIFSALALF